jgi:hypothetical protein
MSGMDEATYKPQLVGESRRLEEDVLHTEKGHFTAARRLRTVHLVLGIIATAGAVIAGARAFASGAGSKFAGIAGLTAALVTAISTFAKPQELAENHHKVGTRYAALRGRLRRFRELTLLQDEAEPGGHQAALEALADQKAELDTAGPSIPRYAYLGAKRSIEEGEAAYRQDRAASKSEDRAE